MRTVDPFKDDEQREVFLSLIPCSKDEAQYAIKDGVAIALIYLKVGVIDEEVISGAEAFGRMPKTPEELKGVLEGSVKSLQVPTKDFKDF